MVQQTPPSPRASWVYAYQLVPPQPEDRLGALTRVLDRERSVAELGDRTWQGRLIVEQQVTHILIVSDSPEVDVAANRRVEAELRRVNAGFAITVPLAVRDEPALARVEPGEGT